MKTFSGSKFLPRLKGGKASSEQVAPPAVAHHTSVPDHGQPRADVQPHLSLIKQHSALWLQGSQQQADRRQTNNASSNLPSKTFRVRGAALGTCTSRCTTQQRWPGVTENMLPVQDLVLESCRLEDFEMGRVLGTGSFGRVSLARHRATGVVCAIKALSKAHIVKNQQVRCLGTSMGMVLWR